MQRTENGFIIISCDFCGTDWDEVKPMIEGHHGSVICLECLKIALDQQTTVDAKYDCTLCLRTLPGTTLAYRPPRGKAVPLPVSANPIAIACASCINQAAGTFSKDPDVDWKRPR